MNKFKGLLFAVLAIFAVATPKVALAQGGNDYRVEARMGGNDQAKAKVVYRERMIGNLLVQKFSVEVERFTPGVAVAITINGATFGNIVPNALGRAELEFRTFVVDDNPHDEEPPLPTDFPRLTAGMSATVGALSGSFRLR
jgi:hypothetical protein